MSFVEVADEPIADTERAAAEIKHAVRRQEPLLALHVETMAADLLELRRRPAGEDILGGERPGGFVGLRRDPLPAPVYPTAPATLRPV